VQVLYYSINSKEETLDLEDAGTPYRFLTAYFAVLGKPRTLLANEGLCKRPIKDLVEALVECGSTINYLGEEGYPPISILGKANLKEALYIDPSLSSQFVSALMLMVPTSNQKTKINFTKAPSSLPYIELTAKVMEHYGIETQIEKKSLSLKGKYKNPKTPYAIESDWTAASYFYAFATLTGSKMTFEKLSLLSAQGDKKVSDLFEAFGIKSRQKKNKLRISYDKNLLAPMENIDLRYYPDLAPTLIVLVALLKAETTFTGLENLKIKESDRVLALQTELSKVGVKITEANGIWKVDASHFSMKDTPVFDTHQDHRIAMALSLVSVFGKIKIENKEVVVKSFPYFWKELDNLDLEIE